MKKYRYYVGVQTSNGMALVSEVNHVTHSASWGTDKAPLELPKSVAMSIAESLTANYISAAVLISRRPRTTHPVATK